MGQKKSAKGTVTISNADKRIRLRWRCQSERYSLNLMQYSKSNLTEAKKVALMIETDLLSGNFDITLNKYRRQQRKPEKQVSNLLLHCSPSAISEVPALAKHFKTWAVSYKNINLDNNLHYSGIYGMLKRWDDISLNKVVQQLNTEKLSVFTYNERLRMLRAFFAWSIKHGLVAFNPLEDVSNRMN